jgi:predicted metal-dependent hydrolase
MFPYLLSYTHNRNAYIKISAEGTVLFTIPQRCKHDEKLMQSLFEKGEKMRKRYHCRPKLAQRNDEGIQLFGEWIPWEESGALQKPSKDCRKLETLLKEILYDYAIERLDIFSTTLGKKYTSLTIRKAKSRRGSCSHHQKIMLNLALVFLPREYIQYVVAHEAAHLVEKNHSVAFWNVVKNLFPDYYAVRKRLRNLVID